MKSDPRPVILDGPTARVETGCGRMYVTLNFQGDRPFEIFIRLGKAGGCAGAQTEATARLLSWGFRLGGDIEEALKHIAGIQCHSPVHDSATSCADAVACAIRMIVEARNEAANTNDK